MKTCPTSWCSGALALLLACHGGAPAGGDGGGSSGGTSGTTELGSDSSGEPGSSSGAGSGDDGSLPPPQCEPDEVACGQLCADLQSDPSNCGECGRSCVIEDGTAACDAGQCALGSCDVGRADCDGSLGNGCETVVDCTAGSACTTACNTTGTLGCGDPCAPACSAPAESCNAIDDDCDGACDQGPLPGCRVGVQRAIGGIGHFYTADPNEVGALGLTLEAADFFFVYPEAVDGLVPLFRCIKPSTGGRRFLTSSTDCEGTAAPELTLGFVAPDARCGAIELYRLYAPGSDDHFYTTSAAERDNAIAMYGYQDQGVAGHVFTAP